MHLIKGKSVVHNRTLALECVCICMYTQDQRSQPQTLNNDSAAPPPPPANKHNKLLRFTPKTCLYSDVITTFIHSKQHEGMKGYLNQGEGSSGSIFGVYKCTHYLTERYTAGTKLGVGRVHFCKPWLISNCFSWHGVAIEIHRTC